MDHVMVSRFRSRRHPHNGTTYTVSTDGTTLYATGPGGFTSYGPDQWDWHDLVPADGQG